MTSESDANHAQIHRIVSSKALKGSEIHRNLLAYLADKSLSGDAQQLKEYTVGLDVFGKPASYDPRQESVVRMHLGRLRQKLAEYYRTEGVDDPVIVDVPKGGFLVTFSPNPEAPVHRVFIPGSPREFILAVLLIVAVVSAGLVAMRASRTGNAGNPDKSVAPTESWTPELKALWSSLLSSDRPLMVTFTAAKSGAAGVSTANAAFLLGQFLGQHKRDVFPISGDSLSVGQITMGDVIFVGPVAGNPHIQAIPPVNVAFILTPDGVKNIKPATGEAAFLADGLANGREDSLGEGYALISCLPGLYGNGTILYFEGNQIATVTGAVQEMTDPDLATQLVARLQGADGALPRYYQAVLKVKAMDGEPMDVSYVSHRELTLAKHEQAAGGAP